MDTRTEDDSSDEDSLESTGTIIQFGNGIASCFNEVRRIPLEDSSLGG